MTFALSRRDILIKSKTERSGDTFVPLAPHGVTLVDGEIFYTDTAERSVRRVLSDSSTVLVAGAKSECKRVQDGSGGNFLKPCGICADHNTLIVVDTDAASVAVVADLEPLVQFLENVRLLYSAFNIHHEAPEPCISFLPEAIRTLNDVWQYFDDVRNDIYHRTEQSGSLDRPDGFISNDSFDTLKMLIEELKGLQDDFAGMASAFGIDYTMHFRLKSTLTLAVENLFSMLKRWASVPTCVQIAIQFSRLCVELVKASTVCPFHHRTSDHPHYQGVHGCLEHKLEFSSKFFDPKVPASTVDDQT